MLVPLNITTKKRAVAVLTPKEVIMLRQNLSGPYQIRTDYLLATAMRISEATYVMNHPECFRAENGAIFLPEVEGMGKVRSTITNRQVMLSKKGLDAVKLFLELKPGMPAYQNLEQVLKRAARDAEIDQRFITTKMYRKTMISWLMCAFPERQEQIAFSAGHDYNTMRQHYITFGFKKEDIKDMRDEVAGWGET